MVAMVGIKEANRGNGVFLAHMLVLAVLALVLYVAYVVVLDAMMNHAEARADRKRNEKLRGELTELKQELNELKKELK